MSALLTKAQQTLLVRVLAHSPRAKHGMTVNGKRMPAARRLRDLGLIEIDWPIPQPWPHRSTFWLTATDLARSIDHSTGEDR